MEPFLDFGLFEFLAACGLAWISRRIYARRQLALGFPVLSCLAPALLLLLRPTGMVRWIAVVCLATALVNAAVLLSLVRAGRLPLQLVGPNREPGREPAEAESR